MTRRPEPVDQQEALLRGAAEALLARLVDAPGARFREGQWEAIRDLVAGRARVLVVQRTGWGKSAVYFVATGLLRARGEGPTLIVSPLLALMRDQVAAAERAGVRAVTINSANAGEWAEIDGRLADDEIDVLLVSPERLSNPQFRERHLDRLAGRTGLLVVDEAHCISDWGHDFRPDYRRIRDLLAGLPRDTPVLATTATANARVVADAVEQLGAGGRPVTTLRGSLARDSLRLGVLRLPDDRDRLAWLAAHLGDLPGSGIVYTLTVAAAEDTASLLRQAGHRVVSYSGRTSDEDRRAAEDALRRNEVKALVATSALGMGFDKPDLGFVVHLGAPASPVAYYQQVGRAGRATERADVLLLPGQEDRRIWDYFATTSMPRQVDAAAVLSALGTAPGDILSTATLEALVDVRRSRLELLLKVLDVDGAVRRVGGGWTATGQPWAYDGARYERVARARQEEADAMVAYQADDGCRMAFLQRMLDDESAGDCGRCDRCAARWYPLDVPAAAREAAGRRLARVGVPLEPRSQWPTGMDRLGVQLRGRIAPEERLREGRVVARLTDLGWGRRLRDLLAWSGSAGGQPDPEAGASADALASLLPSCIAVLRDWDWQERPVAVAVVPSRGRPDLAPSVARALAEVGRLAYLGPLRLARGGPTGRPGGNSAFRLAGVWERFDVPPAMREQLAGLAGRPVLLVDDLVDSRWTMTVAGRALYRAGAGAVLPFALAAVA